MSEQPAKMWSGRFRAPLTEGGSSMLISLSRAYVYMLIPLLLVLIAALVTLHVALLTGSHYEPGGRFFALWFGVNLPILGLAEDRNIWANEVRQSPRWLRITFRSLFVYFFVVALLCIFIGSLHVPAHFFLTASAFMLMFTFGSACVLWAAVRSARLNPKDLHRRTRRSLITVAVFSAAYIIFGLLPSKPIQY